MAVAKQTRQKQSQTPSRASARNRKPPTLQGQDLRRALEELRDTKSERRAKELKRAIAHSICDA
jgi:ribosomal protein L22